MNGAHFHLVVNHLPIILPIAGLIVLAVGMGYRSELVKRTAYLLFGISAITAFMAMNSGEAAEEVVEELGISHHLIHEHEEKAEVMALMSYLLGIVSCLALWMSLKAKKYAHYVSYAVVLLATVTVFLGKQTGTSGGEIRHSEISSSHSSDTSLDLDENHEEEED